MIHQYDISNITIHKIFINIFSCILHVMLYFNNILSNCFTTCIYLFIYHQNLFYLLIYIRNVEKARTSVSEVIKFDNQLKVMQDLEIIHFEKGVCVDQGKFFQLPKVRKINFE